ncbi:aminotransferase class I/II-fold pyridoxal phosphate-dependent enzyme [Sulfobacillus acidophilus]|uniref:Aminotransferase class I/II-fold pyridoxal phosphate-dependent enzyme n=1 Tax=Sulfobacillus acidophilus TaxID=53633 RepID=A0ABS3AWY0_9FIRM|nr:aminotransferase class I/II-fold pyridoxal phosphate-dependent enzyme [Sulfobacillus acidophilus]
MNQEHNLKTFVELAQMRAANEPNKVGYTFLSGEDKHQLTYQQLDEKAKGIANALLQKNLSGQRALLLYMPGFDYITAFFGCLYAGVVAVPAYPPDPNRLNRTLPRLLNVIVDSQSSVILTTSFIESVAQEMFKDSQQSLQWLSSDLISPNKKLQKGSPNIGENTLAFLQYTSGSTSNPRGVMLSHQNLLSNLQLAKQVMNYGENPHGVSWLPPYHDMGLIGGILQPLLVGFEVTLMSPLDFLSNPFLWLKTISDTKATASAGPNFAYDLCVKRIKPEQKKQLDLSNWTIAVNGAEPVRLETMNRFADCFASCGFKRSYFHPCYGLAESTLYVSGGRKNGSGPKIIDVDGKKLEKGKVVLATINSETTFSLVGCGTQSPTQKICVVDPNNKTLCSDKTVGEIWVSHKSVASGYWNKPKKNKAIFFAYTSDTKEGPFLRTGDLGFLFEGELFVTGRIKDMIIIRGRNHYPQDIEKTIENCHKDIRYHCGAAFCIEKNDNEALVAVFEVKNYDSKKQLKQIISAIRNAVNKNHDLQIHSIVLIKPKAIPKTSSGKIQRHACKNMYKQNQLDEVHIWHSDNEEIDLSPTISNEGEIKKNQTQALKELSILAAKALGIKSKNIKTSEPLVHYGLDSLMRQELIGLIEESFGKKLHNDLIDESTTLQNIAEFLKEHKASTLNPKRKNIVSKNIPAKYYDFSKSDEYLTFKKQILDLENLGIKNPYFDVHQKLVRDTTQIGNKKLINFSNYNYIGMAGDEYVSKKAKKAIDRYGTSVCASRLVSGERPLHKKLEEKIASFTGAKSSLVFVSGHATNVSTIGNLFGKGDLIVYDSYSHNSILQGCELSKAKSVPFVHNDFNALDQLLFEKRAQYERVVIVIEGIYSMDGDIPYLPKFIEVKKRHKCFLMIDEAHSTGALGKNGRGISEYFNTNPKDVDLFMGTLSKSFASCGGYIAGSKELIEYLSYSSPGFVYSVGISPANTAAALAAIELLEKEPKRVKKLHENSKLFLSLAKSAKLNTGQSKDSPIIPIILGCSIKTLILSQKLYEKGINVRPIIYPAVAEKAARLRFFITSCHSKTQIEHTVKIVAEEFKNCASL